MWQMIKLLWRRVGNRKVRETATVAKLGTIQAEILSAIALDNFCTVHNDTGEIEAFITWEIKDGRLYASNCAATKPGQLRQMIVRIKQNNRFSGAFWHRTKNSQWRVYPKQRGKSDGTYHDACHQCSK